MVMCVRVSVSVAVAVAVAFTVVVAVAVAVAVHKLFREKERGEKCELPYCTGDSVL